MLYIQFPSQSTPTKQNVFVVCFFNLGLTVSQNYFTHHEPRQALVWMKTDAHEKS